MTTAFSKTTHVSHVTVTHTASSSTSTTWAVPANLPANTPWTPPPGVVIQGYTSEHTSTHPLPASHALSPIEGTLVVSTNPSTSTGTVTLVGTDHSANLPFLFSTNHSN
jgi:hypothetical protein